MPASYLLPPPQAHLRATGEKWPVLSVGVRFLPYYIKPTVFNCWGPFALFQRWLGLELPGDDGEKYGPDGYVVEDLGPTWMFGVKRDERNKEIKAMVEQMARQRKVGCPFR